LPREPVGQLTAHTARQNQLLKLGGHLSLS